MLIQVTKEHIQKGIGSCCSKCPIALAIHEATGDTAFKVGGYGFLVGKNHFFKNLPKEVVNFIARFDLAYQMQQYDVIDSFKPFSFEFSF